ncbi:MULTISPECIES: hypothetical protein [unclassified Sphingobacterium]|uniref:hypothetical protein n=1 Tax=unclassified Sphingobacterium TaxID=2609468 RepID=UPI00104B3E3E|nr:MULTISPECIES: hypothetical protein [unclassified Sphingobacterium]MCS3552690.1 hypothetical protein [Sphingobacterium sp. JUb21]TCR10552.1 hypothetical protein EDF66_101366 [Sphingobacterium sp. JUb20]
MTVKLYEIFLDNKKIATTELENADAPMGVVYGRVTFDHIDSGYDFLKTYCLTNNIVIISDYPEDKLIGTANIPNLKVVNLNGIEIKGQVTNIEGMDSDVFEIIICGISYPFFEEEFPHHVKTYNDQFKDIQ